MAETSLHRNTPSTQAGRAAAGALVGLMAGDCLGMRFEGKDRSALRHRLGAPEDIARELPAGHGAATQMAIALAQSLAAAPSFDGDDFADRLKGLRTHGRGYGAGTLSAIERLKAGQPWQDAGAGFGGRGSSGNGAAVRSAPVGIVYGHDADMLKWVAEEQASLTHAHAMAAEGAVLQAAAVAIAAGTSPGALEPDAFLLEVGGESTMREFKQQYESAAGMALRRAEPERVVARLGNAPSALGSVVTAAYAFATYPDQFELAVAYAVSLGGNTAAIASMTGAIAGAHLGLDAVPAAWQEAIAGESIGRDAAVELGERLAATRV